MANMKNKHVIIKVDKHYFDNFFEPERKRLGSIFGREFKQREFTAFISHSGAKIKYPKMNKKFFPKNKGGFGFNF